MGSDRLDIFPHPSTRLDRDLCPFSSISILVDRDLSRTTPGFPLSPLCQRTRDRLHHAKAREPADPTHDGQGEAVGRICRRTRRVDGEATRCEGRRKEGVEAVRGIGQMEEDGQRNGMGPPTHPTRTSPRNMAESNIGRARMDGRRCQKKPSLPRRRSTRASASRRTLSKSENRRLRGTTRVKTKTRVQPAMRSLTSMREHVLRCENGASMD